MAAGQQLAGACAGRVQEGQPHRRGRARCAGNARITPVDHVAARGFHRGDDQLAGIDVVHAHFGLRVLCLYQPALDRIRAHGRQHVAAVGRGIDHLLLHPHLGEQIVHVGIGAAGAVDDGHFAGQCVAAADAVDLQRVARTHHLQQQAVALGGIGRQIAGQEERALGGTAAHEHAGNAEQIVGHTCDRLMRIGDELPLCDSILA
ncbi:hypothetical protein D3C73_972000 [compost metagenome]